MMGCLATIGFTWNYYKGVIFERKKTNTVNNCITFTNMSVSLIEDVHKTTYTKGQVKS